jgi:hypothetical protein
MRIVDKLLTCHSCSNCGHTQLGYGIDAIKNEVFLQCPRCTEEIYGNDHLTPIEFEKWNTIMGTDKQVAKTDKELFVFEMREEIGNLSWNVYDSNTQILVENIQNILNRIIDYIEEN